MTQRRAHGQLKARVLALLRDADAPLSARELLERWPDAEPQPALTTMLTVLDRLRRAGIVERAASAGEHRFAPVAAPASAAAASMLEALVTSDDRGGALLSFAGSLSDDDLRLLRQAIDRDAR